MTAADVLVTGGTGYLAGRLIATLLGDGHAVRATVRSLDRAGAIREGLRANGIDDTGLEVVAADLTSDEGWDLAMQGCTYVQHVASPFPARQPRDEDEVIRPAVDGTVRVLAAARQAGVRRVVFTSSFAAIGYSPKPDGTPYDETDWTDPTDEVGPYVRSKTLAERAVWDFCEHHPDAPEIAVVNPVGIFGPALGADHGTSVGIIANLLEGRPAVLPHASFAVVDVRDVAALLRTAMVHDAAAGRRFLAAAGQPVTLPWIADVLRSRLGAAAAHVPVETIDDDLVRQATTETPELEAFVGLLGPPKRLVTTTATEVLGWRPRPIEDTLVDTARGILGQGAQRARLR